MAVRNLSPAIVAATVVLIAAAPLTCFARSTPFLMFPPADCSATELRVIAWQDGAPSTTCVTAKQILKLALPGCKSGQQVIFDGGDFVCRDAPKQSARDVK